MEPSLSSTEADRLLDIAEAAIAAGLRGGRPSPPVMDGLPRALAEPRGVFVTVLVDGELNGCIGSMESDAALAAETARQAWAAAFDDPRLPRLTEAEFGRAEIEVSVLSPMEPMPAASREDVLGWLRPFVDGLLIAGAGRRAVFLPAVWEKLPDADDFLDHLLHKAGLARGGRSWLAGMQAWRFTADKHSRPVASARARG